MDRISCESIKDANAHFIAHRGYSSKYPENTLVAFQKAIDEKAHFIEFDVQLSRDGIPMVFHDSHILRTTNSPFPYLIARLTVAELKRFDCGAWFGEEFAGTTIPTLEEVLQLDFKDTGLMIELKQEHAISKELVHLVSKVIQKKWKNPSPERLRIGSFCPHILKNMQEHYATDYLCGILNSEDYISPFQLMGIKHLVMDHPMVTAPLADHLISKGSTIWTYTVDDQKTASELIKKGVKGIISNSLCR